MDTWSYEFWMPIIQFGILLSALLIGNTLRRKIPFIKKSLLPSAVIGGLIVLFLKFIPQFNDLINNNFMEAVAYHCLAIGFVAITLKSSENKDEEGGGIVVKTGAIVVSTYMVQGVVGLIITIALSFVMANVLPASGLLMMLGFGQGPGQALNFGGVYEDGYGFEGGRSFGLTLATIGFLVACIIGVIFLNVLKRQGKLRNVEEVKGNSYQTIQDVSNPNDIPLSESVDKFTVNVAIVALCYFVAYVCMAGVTYLLDAGYLGNFGINTVKPLIWGFNFLFGTLFALLAKFIINKLQKTKVMKRNYTNNFLLNRISGLVFDVMILAAVSAIEFEELKGLWLPIVLLSVVGTAVTMIYLNYVCKRVYPRYRYEAFASLYGMLTGTASTGMILLREVDPMFETPAANNLVLQTVPAMVFGFPLLMLVGYAPIGLAESLITMGIAAVMFVAFNIFILHKKKVKEVNKEA